MTLIRFKLFIICCFLSLLTNLTLGFELWHACFDNDRQQFVIYQNQCPSRDKSAATANFTNAVNRTGWAYLEVRSDDRFSNEMQAYAAGLVEAAATRTLIDPHWKNTAEGYCNKVRKETAYCKRLKNYLRTNLKWMKSEIDANPQSPYWEMVRLGLLQLAGLEDAYYDGVPALKPHLDIKPFRMLYKTHLFQINGELGDLERAFNKTGARTRLTGTGHCSAFIKPLPGNTDLVFAHSSWSTYQSMLRILKLYSLPYKIKSPEVSADVVIPGHTISMSSYPGTLQSIDDFYLTSDRLAITETTISNDNMTLFKMFVKPTNSVWSWLRTMTATRLADSARIWVDYFAKYNSGTYNNQWMVVDYKHFIPNQHLPGKDLLYVLEQLPGFIMYSDMSSKLAQQGYWPSYNVPYFPSIFNLSGQPDFVRKYGDWFTYDKTPRAKIFARDWRNVTDLNSLVKLMRYNNYRKDPLSRCECQPPYSAENAIAARCDLNPKNGSYPFAALGHRSHGEIDAKATSFIMSQNLEFIAQSGPTFDQQPPFRWSTSDFAHTTPHFAHPDLFQFKPIHHKWTNNKNA